MRHLAWDHLVLTPGAITRVALDWAFQTLLPPDETQLSVVREEDARLATAQATAIDGSQDSQARQCAG